MMLRVRGVIEGFYGPPWSHAERLDLIAFCARHGMNTWVHAPKDDPYHRARWRDPYPEAKLQQLAELAAHAERHGVDFVYALAPGLSICYSSEADWAAVLGKCEQLRGAGVRSFQLLWDDIEHTLNCPEDEELYGHEERPSGAAQAVFCNRFAREFRQPGPLVVCPMGYAGTGDSPYRQIFCPRLDPEIVVYWTGPEVVSAAIGREELDVAVARFRGHELLLWDNYPVNDFAPETLFLAPYRGRDPRLADGRLYGVVANAMVQAVPSKLALATIAKWLRDPAAYDPIAAYERALRDHGAEVVEALRALAPASADVTPPDDVARLVDALALGVDAPTALALLEPYA
ncbi:MAG: beta-N-acetylglucosaminidase domain-containing protein [Thermoleophilia bacterium]|nr:beta-N-acetylglucosaminidase domain-containing protein [Thermoleophilia bacterium]